MAERVKKKKMTKEERLEALRQKIANTDTGGGSSDFWGPDEGKHTIRILPAVGEMDWFFQPVGVHYLPDNTKFYCPSFTSEGEEDCPLCDIVASLYAKGYKDLAGKLRVTKKYWMNIIVRKGGGDYEGPFIYTPGVTVFTAISALVGDPDYGDISDEYEGCDIVIERKGTGKETEYSVVPRRAITPLVGKPGKPDEDAIDAIIEKARNLAWVLVGDDEKEDKELAGDAAIWVKPYDRLIQEHKLDQYKVWEYGEDDDDDEDDDDPYEEVAEVEEDDFQDEDDDEEPAPVKEVAKRQARRRSRK